MMERQQIEAMCIFSKGTLIVDLVDKCLAVGVNNQLCIKEIDMQH